ncbi:Nif3-like dinuclear metal center hexameric protein [Thaumasiovibrio subtropicus]|uniref:Nif3-like dinuclear metal center hexameric protein n=1 Tax=Thaumasiovibrio subtropicus TaxID=1891207 RepID=UPI000B357A57|nr:Nif3-like dinuclear metal center hexameric protein [Thaumasiovibrio subtropicus]
MNNLVLEKHLNSLLSSHLFKDYCPNGLQVEGKSEVTRIMTGVTACQALIDRAVEAQVDALLVHHGFFWKGEPEPIRGMKFRRIKALIDNGINLYAYHLPVDVHPSLGNNARLGKLLGVQEVTTLEPENPCALIGTGHFTPPISAKTLAQRIESALARQPLHIASEPDKLITTLGWCTGGGQDFIEQAANANLDAFISGEISERTTHSARELGIDYFAAGHHATERYGIKALGEHLVKEYGVSVQFVDIDNPV